MKPELTHQAASQEQMKSPVDLALEINNPLAIISGYAHRKRVQAINWD
jgi:hypothetical protein